MHRDVTASEPGDCPICGMALEAAGSASRRGAAPDRPDAIALAALRSSDEATGVLRFSVAPARRDALPGELVVPAVARTGGAIVAQLYRDELASVDPGEAAVFTPARSPATEIAVRRDASSAIVAAADDATAQLGFRIAPGAAPAPPGTVGWITLAYKIRPMLVVRSTAILEAPGRHYVLVFSAEHATLTPRTVEIGKTYAGVTAIVSGLHDKELVAMGNGFSLDAARRLEVSR
jgi:hypothetical protein